MEPLESRGWIGSARVSSPKANHQDPSGHRASQPPFFLPGFSVRGSGEGGEELGACPVSPECEARTCSQVWSERGPQNPTWPRGPAPELEPGLRFLLGAAQGAKCIIKRQKGSTLRVKDNGGNLLDGL